MPDYPSFALTGQVALVTGAARGLGRAIALALADAGADVALGLRRAGTADDLRAEIEAMGRRSLDVQMDVTDLAQIGPAVDAVVEGLGRLDILVNNAGLGPANRAEDVNEADFDLTMDVNVKGLFFASQAAGRAMIRQGSGRIVNLSSQAGFVALPTEAIYCASKAAVSHLTKCLAVEWGQLRHHRQRGRADVHPHRRHRRRPGRRGLRGRRSRADRRAAPDRRTHGRRGRGGLPRLSRCQPDHRHDPPHRRRMDGPLSDGPDMTDARPADVRRGRPGHARRSERAQARQRAAPPACAGSGILLAFVVLIVVGALQSEHFLTFDNLVERRPPGVDHRDPRHRHDVRHPDRRHRPVGRVDRRLRRPSRYASIHGQRRAVAAGHRDRARLPARSSGAINGLGITRGGIQPFIMTLGMLVIARGVTMTYSDGKPIRVGEAAADIAWLGTGTCSACPVPFVLFMGIAAPRLVRPAATRRSGARSTRSATTSRRRACRASRRDRVIFSVYVISGLCAAVVGADRRRPTRRPREATQGEGFELDAIAIVVIGGTSLFGGEGGIGGTRRRCRRSSPAINNLLNLLGVSPFSQRIVKGLIILGAVLLERRTSGQEEGR